MPDGVSTQEEFRWNSGAAASVKVTPWAPTGEHKQVLGRGVCIAERTIDMGLPSGLSSGVSRVDCEIGGRHTSAACFLSQRGWRVFPRRI